jgi:hypothetical protein
VPLLIVKSVPLWGITTKVGNDDLPKVRYPLKRPFRDASPGDRASHVIFEPLDFIGRLVALVHKPRVDLSRLDEKHPCFSSYGQAVVGLIHSR